MTLKHKNRIILLTLFLLFSCGSFHIIVDNDVSVKYKAKQKDTVIIYVDSTKLDTLNEVKKVKYEDLR